MDLLETPLIREDVRILRVTVHDIFQNCYSQNSSNLILNINKCIAGHNFGSALSEQNWGNLIKWQIKYSKPGAGFGSAMVTWFCPIFGKKWRKALFNVKNTCKFLCFIYKMLFGFIEFNFFFTIIIISSSVWTILGFEWNWGRRNQVYVYFFYVVIH